MHLGAWLNLSLQLIFPGTEEHIQNSVRGKSAIVILQSVYGFQESTATEISFPHAQINFHHLQPFLAEKGSVFPVKAFDSNPSGSISQNKTQSRSLF